MDLPYEQSGNIPSIKSLNNKIYKAPISYGYGAQMTFLQMLNAYTVFNNGGVMISPRQSKISKIMAKPTPLTKAKPARSSLNLPLT